MSKKIIIIIAAVVIFSGAMWAFQQVGPWLLSMLEQEPENEINAPPVGFEKQEAIKKLFADKYNKELEEINISIDQETEEHIQGGVEIAPGGPENSGVFLAVKIGEHWELVFDGQGGVSCEELEKYNFPENMAGDCFRTQTIEARKDESFFITLEANPTTGYGWQADFDADYIELINQEYVPDSTELIGSGGNEAFEFRALKSGQAEITLVYLRSWEEEEQPIEQKVYTIIIQ